jgi:TetR/AcrR family transcriptional regulator, transcriptional repressor for nem operon
MGRPQSFDTTTAVQAARDVFWDKGLDAASLPDLERATGLSRSSLYHAFRSKRGLFDAAVQDYLDTVVRPRLRVLTDEPGPDAVVTYLTGLAGAIAALPAGSPRRGCLLLACATGPAGHDEALRTVVDDYRRELHTAFAGALAARHPDLGADVLADRARQMVAHAVTALVLARVDPDSSVATLETAVAQVRAWDAAG